MSASVLVGARLIDPASGHDGPGDIRIRDGVIVEVANQIAPYSDETVIELQGAALAPALIDLRCRIDPASAGQSGLEVSTRAAAAGGVGTVVIAPDSGTGFARPEDFALLDAAALISPVRLAPAGLVVDSDGDMGEIGLMLGQGAVLIGDGGRPVEDSRLLRRILAYASGFEAWVSLRCEDAGLAAATCASESDLATRLGFAVRPPASERMAIERHGALAELTGAQILFDRITTQAGLEALQAVRSRGLDVAATAPIAHLLFNEVDMGGYDARFRLEPPLRSECDRDALIAALSDGELDAIVSDHLACTGEAKAHPFPEAAAGGATLEALLPALCTLAAEGRVSLIDALRPVTSGPADILGLKQGRIEPGAPADLVAFEPNTPIVYGRQTLECRAPTPFQGRRLFGRVLLTLVEGAIIHQPEG